MATQTIPTAKAAQTTALTLLRSFGYHAEAVTTRYGNAIKITLPGRKPIFQNTLREAKEFLTRRHGVRF